MTKPMHVRPAPHLTAIASYPLASLVTGTGRRLVSLAQNESPCEPAPSARTAASEALASAALYPDPDCTGLRTSIAAVHGLDPQSILCGSGSMELISAVGRAYLAPGDRALTSAYGYLYFRTAALLIGAAVDLAPEKDLTVDVAAMVAALKPRTRVAFVANPGNPTGTRIGRGELIKLRDQLPQNVLLVIDEAYGEFAEIAGERSWDLVDRGNTVVLRSFSKAYGLAGLRAGWGLFPPAVASEVRKALLPNNIGTPSQAAAEAAIRDQTWMRATVATITARRDRFAARMRRAGIGSPPSWTNFVLLEFPSAKAAAEADAKLRAEGIALRALQAYGLDRYLRATIGTEEDMTLTAEVLETSVAKV
jgi:histidinol-phosphate aminotransferase